MTKDQINYILETLSAKYSSSSDNNPYAANQWIKADQIAALNTLKDSSIYPGKAVQLYFDNIHEVLKTRQGKYLKDGSFQAETEPSAIYDYAAIYSITLVTPNSMKDPFAIGKTL